jgi:large conductance mechanosensitive channel
MSKKNTSAKKSVDPKALASSGKDFWREFTAFALQGNVIDLAVGIVIGGAFNAIVQSLVKDVVMPIFGWALNGVAFDNLYVSLAGNYDSLAEAQAAGAPVILYGVFITQVINFLIIALSVFVVLKFVMKKDLKK